MNWFWFLLLTLDSLKFNYSMGGLGHLFQDKNERSESGVTKEREMSICDQPEMRTIFDLAFDHKLK